MKSLKLIFLLLLLLQIQLYAVPIDISKENNISLLHNSEVYLDKEVLSLETIITNHLFQPYQKQYINTGMLSRTIWIKFTLVNSSSQSITKALVLTSPLLEHIVLYTKGSQGKPQLKGVSHIRKDHHTLFPYYSITLEAHSSKQYYIEVKSERTPVDFTINIEEEKTYLSDDRLQQFINILLIGFVLALMLYSFVLFFYTHDKSYIYYSLYLLALLCQQMTYLGLTQIYFPLIIITIDMLIPVFKVNILVITAALFAIHFLKIQQMPRLYFIYKLFIIISIIEILVLSSSYFYNLYIVIFTGALFIIFNLVSGIISYKKGHTQARLFIVGFSIVFVSYILIILNAIGLTSIMQDFQNILMFGTAFEALVLSLAFADKYIILQKEKEKVDARILKESTQRTAMVESEVLTKTQELNNTLEIKELLLKEVHHRVKNNLQITLSIIRLQNDEIEDKKVNEKFTNLENRINAISKTYNMLLIKDNLEEIDMQEYIDSLLTDIQEGINYTEQNIDVLTDIDAKIPLRESVYIGLIINELITNAYKYAFDDNKGTITISLKQNKHDYILTIEDNGKGYSLREKPDTLGLKLIHTLVYHQLDGEMETETNAHTKNIIRFKL